MALQFNNLTLGYGRHPAVHHLSGQVAKGSLTAVVGPNGAGKSTLLKGIAGFLQPLEGHIASQSQKRTIAYLPQSAEIDRTFPMNVFDFVASGLWQKQGLWQKISAQNSKIEQAIEAVGLHGFEHRPIGTLSGGQMQRVLFARLMLQDSQLILLDEPFTAIDSKTMTDLIALVHRWHCEERTIIAVLHDLELVKRSFPETLLLAREPVAWGATKDVLSAENLLKARRMVEASNPFADICQQTDS